MRGLSSARQTARSAHDASGHPTLHPSPREPLRAAPVTRRLMIQGAGTNVGKSLLVAGLCRAFTRRGLRVRPFKPQNMSNNAAVASDGGEIGRAQALQARACRAAPSVHMNPVLLKPETETGAQVVVRGRRIATVRARDYAALKPSLMAPVLDSFARTCEGADLVLVEGAGSPAEINLRENDIANMGFAARARVPVVLVGDIDRGGVIAQMVGTRVVLDSADAALIGGFIINKFRGDVTLFEDGYRAIAAHTGWTGYGVAPWFDRAYQLPAEDAVDAGRAPSAGRFRIAVPLLSRIANFDDLDPLVLEPDVRVEMIRPGTPIPVEADLVILPGTKSTRGDLAFLRREGWDIDLKALVRRGGRVLGLCGGYQMLGGRIDDPHGTEGAPGSMQGLGLLDVDTVMLLDKRVTETKATHLASGTQVAGYEIHIGRTAGPDCARPLFDIAGTPEGAMSPSGRVMGSYLHGLFGADAFRTAFLGALGATGSDLRYDDTVETALDALADHMETHLDCDGLWDLAGRDL